MRNLDEWWFAQPFVAKLTAKSGATPIKYAWTEQTYGITTGTFADASPGRSGTTSAGWAEELNNADVSVGSTLVNLRLKGMVDGEPRYVFQYPASAGGGSVTLQESDGAPSGVVTTINCDQSTGVGVSSVAAGAGTIYGIVATTSQQGVVSTTAQSFGGSKFFAGTVFPAQSAATGPQVKLQSGSAGTDPGFATSTHFYHSDVGASSYSNLSAQTFYNSGRSCQLTWRTKDGSGNDPYFAFNATDGGSNIKPRMLVGSSGGGGSLPIAVKLAAAPSTTTSAGMAGDWYADASWFYVCYSDNNWRRVALATF
jgi:hypothetical protein